jgi:hypothetical protein
VDASASTLANGIQIVEQLAVRRNFAAIRPEARSAARGCLRMGNCRCNLLRVGAGELYSIASAMEVRAKQAGHTSICAEKFNESSKIAEDEAAIGCHVLLRMLRDGVAIALRTQHNVCAPCDRPGQLCGRLDVWCFPRYDRTGFIQDAMMVALGEGRRSGAMARLLTGDDVEAGLVGGLFLSAGGAAGPQSKRTAGSAGWRLNAVLYALLVSMS